MEEEIGVLILVPEGEDGDWIDAPGELEVKRIPRALFDDIVTFLAHPETGVRMERPEKKETNG